MRDFSLNHHYNTALQLADYFDAPYKPYIYVLYKKLLEGHICVRKELVEPEVNDGIFAQDGQQQFVPGTLPDKGKFIVACEGYLYLHRYYQYETSIIDKIKSLLREDFSGQPRKGLPGIHEEDGSINWQSVAIIASLRQSFTIITGGPGTGKTTTVAKILSQLISENTEIRIGLAAPTGKAAARMAESLQQATGQLPDAIKVVFNTLEPLTIHRLLGPKRKSISFRHNAENPLPLDVLIVDECSMIDIALFYRLLDAVGKNTRLILLGDRNQLASVEAGSLFGDLCDAGAELNTFSEKLIHAIEEMTGSAASMLKKSNNSLLSDHIVELQKSYRFSNDKGIGRLSQAIVQQNEETVKDFFSTADDQVLIDTAYSPAVFKTFAEGFEACIQEPDTLTALKKLNQCKILCAIKEGTYGLYNTNLRVEKVLEERGMIKRQKDFYEHRPVMITRNNYELQLYNGDTGIVRRDKEGKLKVWFEIDNEVVGYAPSMISNCETAYAITIHKSQGSEFDRVLVLLPEFDLPLLTKELLYTAVTRARNHVAIQSSEAAFLGASRKSVERGSGIKYRLK